MAVNGVVRFTLTVRFRRAQSLRVLQTHASLTMSVVTPPFRCILPS